MSKERVTLLIQKAKEGLKNSYAPYSCFHVGAAVLTEDGSIFTGCNIENASYGGTVCAERVALFKAVSEGYRSFTDLAIVCDGENYPMPCGICRQVMAEFMPNATIHVVCGENIKSFAFSELLPHAFEL